jgi:ABC-type branched-subunit amino acid transport system substrate-binding protein
MSGMLLPRRFRFSRPVGVPRFTHPVAITARDSAGRVVANWQRTPVERVLRHTKGYRGATGTITIDKKTGYRTTVPVSILRVNNQKKFVVAR